MPERHHIFGGDYSEDMWKAIRCAKTKNDLASALYLVCCRIQELEARFERRWAGGDRRVGNRGDHVACWEEEPFQVWKDIGRDCLIVFTPDARKIGCLTNEEYAERMCRELNECWAFSREAR